MIGIRFLDALAVILVIIGGLNWGLIGLFSFNLVAFLFGDATAVTRIIYALVGLSALYAATRSPSHKPPPSSHKPSHSSPSQTALDSSIPPHPQSSPHRNHPQSSALQY